MLLWASALAYATRAPAVRASPWRPTPAPANPVARSRAATTAQSVALLAVSWITPPPGPELTKCPGRPSMPHIQSITCVSSSVHAGDVLHSMPCTPRPADSSSPRMLGPDAFAGK